MKRSENKDYIARLTYTSLFAALVCITTMVVQIPTPTKGYFNLGDVMVLLSGWFLGPVYGVAAAAIGSMLADVFTSYFVYAHATFILKGLVAFLGYVIARALRHVLKKHTVIAYGMSAIIAELAMVLGYYLFEALFIGYGFVGALLSVPNNLMQGIVCVICGTALFVVLNKIQIVKRFLNQHGFIGKD